MQITICGGGNAAHTAAGIASARGKAQVNVYVPFADEERRWKEGLSEAGGIAVHFPDQKLLGLPGLVSSDAARVITQADLVLLTLPAFAHEQVIKEIAAYVKPGAALGAMPARGGFEWGVKSCMGNKIKSITLFGLQTLPWACRIKEYGRSVQVKGTKEQVDLASYSIEEASKAASQLETIFGVSFKPVSSFLSLTLSGTGQLLHPGLMYSLFHGWRGEPFEDAPLFYQGVDQPAASLLEQLSEEVAHLRGVLEDQLPSTDLFPVRPLIEWLRFSYNGSIANPQSLLSCLRTNSSYSGLTAPMRKTGAGLVPDFHSRYLSEDVPYGLVVTRGIAELAGVKTPVMDEVIHWSQDRLGQEFLKNGKLRGKDVAATRSPQRYGMKTLDLLI